MKSKDFFSGKDILEIPNVVNAPNEDENGDIVQEAAKFMTQQLFRFVGIAIGQKNLGRLLGAMPLPIDTLRDKSKK